MEGEEDYRFVLKTVDSFGKESYIVMDSEKEHNSYQTDIYDLAISVLNAMNDWFYGGLC